jgi:hypothetical protein
VVFALALGCVPLAVGNRKLRVSAESWAFFEKPLPRRVNTHRFGGGRPRRSDRDCLNGILFVLRTRGQWKVLDAIGTCPASTAHYRTQDTGIVEGDTEACLTGIKLDGTVIGGCDSIKTVGDRSPVLADTEVSMTAP